MLVGGLGGVLIGRYWSAEASTGTPAEVPRPRTDAVQRDRSPGATARAGGCFAILLASVVILVALAAMVGFVNFLNPGA